MGRAQNLCDINMSDINRLRGVDSKNPSPTLSLKGSLDAKLWTVYIAVRWNWCGILMPLKSCNTNWESTNETLKLSDHQPGFGIVAEICQLLKFKEKSKRMTYSVTKCITWTIANITVCFKFFSIFWSMDRLLWRYENEL